MGHFSEKDRRLPGDPAPAKEPEMGMTWRCSCGRAVLQHFSYCVGCSAERPKPAKAK